MNQSKALIVDGPSHFETNNVMLQRVSIGDCIDDDAVVSEFEGFGFEFDKDDVSIFSFNTNVMGEDKSPSQQKKRAATPPMVSDNDDDAVNTTHRQAKKLRSSSNSKQTIDNDCAEHLTVGDVVYAAHREAKKRGKSSAIFRRGTVVEVVKKDQRSLSYGIAFGNRQKLKVIDESLVVSEHRYLHDNLKKVSAIISVLDVSAVSFSVVDYANHNGLISIVCRD